MVCFSFGRESAKLGTRDDCSLSKVSSVKKHRSAELLRRPSGIHQGDMISSAAALMIPLGEPKKRETRRPGGAPGRKLIILLKDFLLLKL